MKVAVIVPEDYMGDVIGDLNARRGQIQGMEARPGAQQIDALVPLSRDVRLRHRPALPHPGPRPVLHGAPSYVEIPKNIAEKIIASAAARMRTEQSDLLTGKSCCIFLGMR